MLYDPKRTADPFQLETLVSWFECQPPEEAYDYGKPCDCALARYFSAHGFRRAVVTAGTVTDGWDSLTERDLPPNFNLIVLQTPHTMGAALARARKWLA